MKGFNIYAGPSSTEDSRLTWETGNQILFSPSRLLHKTRALIDEIPQFEKEVGN